MNKLASLECSELLRFDQCVTEQTAVKPTTLPLIRLGTVAQQIRALGANGFCPHRKGWHQGAIGRDSATGNFRTAPLKVYSGLFCSILASGFVSHAKRLWSIRRNRMQQPLLRDTLSEEFEEFLQPLDVYEIAERQRESRTVQADFVDTGHC